VQLDFYVDWTFGFYSGTRYDDRFGDMAQPSHRVGALTTAYVLGVMTNVIVQ
jgi:hypothetical protein